MSQEHLPYADDSNAVTPMSEENGAIIVPVSYANFGSRHSSYTSHTSRITYTSHADLFKPPMTKERQLRSRSAKNYFNPSEQRYYRDVRYYHGRVRTLVRKSITLSSELLLHRTISIPVPCPSPNNRWTSAATTNPRSTRSST